MKSPITTHVLDTSSGKPAQGMSLILEREETPNYWTTLAKGTTNADGRVMDLLPSDSVLQSGSYRLNFETGSYYEKQKKPVFYPSAAITFVVQDTKEHYHIPLLISGYGYSTYRGS